MGFNLHGCRLAIVGLITYLRRLLIHTLGRFVWVEIGSYVLIRRFPGLVVGCAGDTCGVWHEGWPRSLQLTTAGCRFVPVLQAVFPEAGSILLVTPGLGTSDGCGVLGTLG